MKKQLPKQQKDRHMNQQVKLRVMHPVKLVRLQIAFQRALMKFLKQNGSTAVNFLMPPFKNLQTAIIQLLFEKQFKKIHLLIMKN